MGLAGNPGDGGRLDAVLDPSFTEGLTQLSLQQLRRRRTDAQAEEARLSYLRRVLQGRLDIVCAQIQRRSSGSGGDLASLLAALPEILSERPAEGDRPPTVIDLSEIDEREGLIEELLRDETLASIPETPVERLGEIVEQLRDEEAFISGVRRQVHAVVDTLRAELTRRYADGRADVGQLLEEQSANQ